MKAVKFTPKKKAVWEKVNLFKKAVNFSPHFAFARCN